MLEIGKDTFKGEDITKKVTVNIPYDDFCSLMKMAKGSADIRKELNEIEEEKIKNKNVLKEILEMLKIASEMKGHSHKQYYIYNCIKKCCGSLDMTLHECVKGISKGREPKKGEEYESDNNNTTVGEFNCIRRKDDRN